LVDCVWVCGGGQSVTLMLGSYFRGGYDGPLRVSACFEAGYGGPSMLGSKNFI